MWSDRGEEFCAASHNQTFLHYLNEQNIQIFSTNSDLKAVFVERFHRTLLDLIKEPMFIEGKGNWLNHLDAALQIYNNRVHGTTKMTPFEINFCAASRAASLNLITNIDNNNHNNKFPQVPSGGFYKSS